MQLELSVLVELIRLHVNKFCAVVFSEIKGYMYNGSMGEGEKLEIFVSKT
jgi:hypothetical protein